MKNTIKFKIKEFRLYWKVRYQLIVFRYWVINHYFSAKDSTTEKIMQTSIVWQFLKLSLKNTAWSIFWCFVLYSVNERICCFFPYAESETISDSYTTLLGTIAGVSGVFIALYYTGLITAGSAIYSRVPNNVRDLLAKERAGSTYMGFLAFITFFAISLITMNALGFAPIRLAAIVISLLSALGVFVFIYLGKSAFNYFDPTKLAEPLIYDLYQSILKVTSDSYLFMDGGVQKHFNKNANSTISTLETLTEIVGTERHLSGDSFFGFSNQVVFVLINYQKVKKKIPTNSLWFNLKYKHEDWYKSDSTLVDIAEQTGTTLPPKTINDTYWFEDELVSIPLKCFQINLREKRYSLCRDVIVQIKRYLLVLVRVGEVGKAFDIYEKIIDVFFESVQGEDLKISDSIDNISTFEEIISIKIDLLITFVNEATAKNIQAITEQVEKTNWLKKKSVYQLSFFNSLFPKLEEMRKKLEFEHEVEGGIVTPQWYLVNSIALWHAIAVDENFSYFLDRSDGCYKKTSSRIKSEANPWLQSCLLSREIEYQKKLERRISVMSEFFVALKAEYKLYEHDWPKRNFDDLLKVIDGNRHELFKKIPTFIQSLTKQTRPNEFPDYFGQFLYSMGQLFLDYCLENKINLAKELYRPFFSGSITKFTELLNGFSSLGSELNNQRIAIAGNPFLDLIDLSGYAKLFADLIGDYGLWNEIITVWNDYLGNPETAPHRLNFLADLISRDRYGSLRRTGFSQRVNRYLMSKVIKQYDRRRTHRLSFSEIVLHEKPLVRVFAEGRFGGFYKGTDIFVAEYFMNRTDATAVDFSNDLGNLKSDIEREDENTEYIKKVIENGNNDNTI